MPIHLHAEHERFLKTLVEAGTYASASDAVQHALFLLEDHLSLRTVKLDKLRELVAEGEASIARGEVRDGEEFFRELRRRNAQEYRKAE